MVSPVLTSETHVQHESVLSKVPLGMKNHCMSNLWYVMA